MKTATAPAGAVLTLRVAGPSGGDWSVRRDHDRWSLWLGRNEEALAEVEMDQETAWRMYVGALPLPEIERRAVITGDADLGRQLLTAFALVS